MPRWGSHAVQARGRVVWHGYPRRYPGGYYDPYYPADVGVEYSPDDYEARLAEFWSSWPLPDEVPTPPLPAADPPPYRIVSFPVMIFNGYRPHWTWGVP
jgi:hypothetical protein